jgi:hypothetical protein
MWRPDSSSDVCFRCRAPFSWWTRRHHCRRCGLLFCGACTSRRVDFANLPSPARACDHCVDLLRVDADYRRAVWEGGGPAGHRVRWGWRRPVAGDARADKGDSGGGGGHGAPLHHRTAGSHHVGAMPPTSHQLAVTKADARVGAAPPPSPVGQRERQRRPSWLRRHRKR